MADSSKATSSSGDRAGVSHDAAVTEIAAPRGLIPLNLHELWEYRDLAFFMLWRDLRGRYRQMALGPLWMIINPIMNVVVFTIIFGKMAKFPSDGVPYPLFSYSALLPWGFFAGSLFTAAGSLLGYKDLISKVYFPRLLIPLVGVLSALVDLLISLVLLLGVAAYFGYWPTLNILFIPVFLFMAAVTGLAVGIWFASWIVHFRDVNAILSYVVRAWMYITPVVYASSFVPERWRGLYRLNPMANIIEGFRWAILDVAPPSWKMLVLSFAATIPILIAGAYYFRRTERSIVDIA
ncbi:MAG: ABC transporter permease [Phycisphaerae bacterium]|nr:ABC transporter permease [Phycisphaerae bacterium]